MSEVDAPIADPYEMWCSNQAASLVGAIPKVSSILSADAVARGLQSLLGSRSAFNLSLIAEYSGCTRRSIRMWLEGSTRPRLESLFRLCYSFDITPVQFLGLSEQADENGKGASNLCSALKRFTNHPTKVRQNDIDRPSSRPRSKRWNALDLDRLRSALEATVDSGEYVSPRKIAKGLGYSSPDRMLQRLAGLCAALNARRNETTQARKLHIRTILENALVESSPPALRDIASSLGLSSSTALRLLEPELCDQILARGKERDHEMLEDVKSIVECALEGSHLLPFGKFCRQAGLSASLIDSRLPDQKKAYDQRYRSLTAAERMRKDESFRREVELSVSALRERGEYPSVGRVVAENPTLRYAGWYRLQGAILSATDAI